MPNTELTNEMLKKTRVMFCEVKSMQIGSALHGEMFILKCIAQKGGPVMPGELSEVSKTSSARVAMALRSLEGKGFVERTADKSDRRKVLVTATESGRAEVKKLHERIHAVMDRMIAELGEEDAREYIRIVDKMIDISRKMSSEEERT